MAIQSVDDLISAIKQQEDTIKMVGEMSKVDPVLWGPPTSLEGGDAAGRMGINMGEPSVKAAAMRNLLIAYNQAEKEAAVGVAAAAAARGALAAGGRLLSKVAPKAMQRVGNATGSAKKVLDAPGVKPVGRALGHTADVAGAGTTAHQIGNLNKTRFQRGIGVG
jgi:hypothetical protein